ncbi:MAG: aminotransferase class V-fold PLP-dependent enzyme [Clostridium sp.]
MNTSSFSKDYRGLVVGNDIKVPLRNGKYITSINFDNAATTPPFMSVLNSINKFAPLYSSSHRGMGYKSQFSTYLYEDGREVILKFINAKPGQIVVYSKNTTDSINQLCNKLHAYNLETGSCKNIILSSYMEHHSNDLPWRDKFEVKYIKLDEDYRLSMEDLKEKLIKYKDKVALVSVSGASNVTGYINPIHDIASLAHKYNAKVLVDGAQLIPHEEFSMKGNTPVEDIDFLVFSAHKIYAPFGVGVLIGSKEFFNNTPPDYKGGGTITFVSHSNIKWSDSPERDEAGSPNIIGIVALSTSIKTLQNIGMKKISQWEEILTNYTLTRIKNISDVELYIDPNNTKNHISIIPFNIKGMSHSMTSKILSYEFGISTRNGCFCAHPYVTEILNLQPEKVLYEMEHEGKEKPGMVRLSFGIYNTLEEIDNLVIALNTIITHKDYYLKIYEDDDFSFFRR